MVAPIISENKNDNNPYNKKTFQDSYYDKCKKVQQQKHNKN